MIDSPGSPAQTTNSNWIKKKTNNTTANFVKLNSVHLLQYIRWTKNMIWTSARTPFGLTAIDKRIMIWKDISINCDQNCFCPQSVSGHRQLHSTNALRCGFLNSMVIAIERRPSFPARHSPAFRYDERSGSRCGKHQPLFAWKPVSMAMSLPTVRATSIYKSFASSTYSITYDIYT